MASLRAEMAADLAAAVALYGQSFEWQGTEYPCVRRDEPTAAELQEAGGFIEGVRYFLVVAKAAFTDGVFPEDGDLINAGTHQIKTVRGHRDAAAVQLVLAIGSADE